MNYSAYAGMLASAQRKPAFWRIAVVLLASFAVTVILMPTSIGIIALLAPELSAIDATNTGAEIGATQGGLFVVLASFAFMIVSTVLLSKKMAHRRLSDLTGPSNLLRAQFWGVLKWILVLSAVIVLIPLPDAAGTLARQLSLGAWLAWMPLAIICVAVQVTAEELLFRGYLQTQLIGATRSYALGMIIPALLFGLGHMSPELDGYAALLPILWATLFGLVVGDLTARSGSLGPAIALHLANNLLAMLFMPVAGQLSGFGLWTRDMDLTEAYSNPYLIAIEVLFLLLTWLTARIALKR